MGMGAIPCHGWTISLEKLKALLPDVTDKLLALLKRHEVTLDDLAQAIDQEESVSDSDDATEEIEEALERLYEQFITATSVDESFLELELLHYDEDLGSRYDELEPGANWLVRGMRHFTPAGMRFKDFVEPKSWTVYG